MNWKIIIATPTIFIKASGAPAAIVAAGVAAAIYVGVKVLAENKKTQLQNSYAC